MDPIKVLILESDIEFLTKERAYFDTQEQFKVIAASSNGNVGIGAIEQFQPDIVLMNLSLSGLDGFGVLSYVQEHNLSCKCFVIAPFTDDKVINSAVKRGASYYFIKPVDPVHIAKRILEILKESNATSYNVASEVRDRRRISSLDEKISNIFISIGIPPHIKGYAYLREGIKMAVETPAIINNVTKELYPNIAKIFDTSASKVERAIRHAIEVAWNRGRVDSINAIFGARVYIGNERPTNSEFIALVADKLLLEEYL